LIVLSLGCETSGVPAEWAAGAERPGVDFLPDLSEATAAGVVERVRRIKRPGDLVVASIHWGSNWGYRVADDEVRFGHQLVDGGVDLVHGHSSHHPRPIEVYRDHLVIHGCGDLIDDYEGIRGHDEFRSDLALLYFAALEPGGRLESLEMVPLRMCRFRLQRAAPDEARWLREVLAGASERFGTRPDLDRHGRFALRWS
jgi:poly-gamma-glutamate synthesis protein (capsule biosynthesis protein)